MQKSMKTPLGRVRGTGSAHSGTGHFWRQRLTGALLIPLALVFLIALVRITTSDPVTALLTLRSGWVSVPLFLFIAIGVAHMRLGMQVIIEDYIHDENLKFLAVAANTLFCLLVGAACLFALAKLNFGI